VGDGLIRLDGSGAIIYASPNAKSAFHRMGLAGELDGNVLGEIARKVSQIPIIFELILLEYEPIPHCLKRIFT
jgi:hypothetical protein